MDTLTMDDITMDILFIVLLLLLVVFSAYKAAEAYYEENNENKEGWANKNSIKYTTQTRDDVIDFIKYGVERILREQRAARKRVDYYSGTTFGPFILDSCKDNYIEFTDEDDKNNFRIKWVKEGSYFEIRSIKPLEKLIGEVETFGKRTDKVIAEVLSISLPFIENNFGN